MRVHDRTIIIAISALAIVLLALFLSGTVSLTVRLPTVTNQAATTATSLTNPTATGQANPIVKITVEAGQRASKWVSGLDGLPHYETGVSWNVCNEGRETADNTEIVVKSDDVVITRVTGSLDSSTCSSAHADLEYSYDTTHQVTVEASSGQSKDSKSLTISADLPRVLLGPQATQSSDMLKIAKLFITPNDPVIEEVSRRIFQESPVPGYTGLTLSQLCPNMQAGGKCPDWMVLDAIEGWVCGHIQTQASADVQLPRETLQSGKGGTTDRAVLIVSLARAAGIRLDRIYVVIGTDGTTCSGWVYDKVDRQYPSMYGQGTDWHHPPWCQCSAMSPECCPGGRLCVQAVYYFNDQIVETAT